ncbi:MAG: hotdog fold thioesterase [Xanthomonadaceae bacterium]|nr:hotdog fold thioesterase [Xanthomonadaceae bacterium]
MPIWKQPVALEQLNALNRNTMMAAIGIVFTEVGDDYLRATMPVDARTYRPYGMLHGGASAALAETLGSTGGMMTIGAENGDIVGIEINANHVRAVRSGVVTGTARPLHLGRSTQVWEIRIEDEQQRLVCISRLTLAVVARNAV